jgi:hypothetical protein
MGSPWPAPLPDEQMAGRGPNYTLRRAIVALVVIAIVGAAAAWIIRREGDDDADDAGNEDHWNTVVLQNDRTGELSLVDAEGVELETFPSKLMGLLDVGLADRLVVGVAGDPATDGLGVIDLDSGEITELVVESDGISRLDTSAYLVASNGPRDPLGLIDVAAGEVLDLLQFVDTDDPIVDPSLIRIDPEHSHVAFTELGELETVLVDLATDESVSLAGSVVDIASDAVLTITNRGLTSLVDLYGFDGERIGTVETDSAAGGLLLDDRSALVVTRAGGLVRVDFDDESVDDVGSVADQLTTEATDGDDSVPADDNPQADDEQLELVRGLVPVLDRTRLVVLGEGGMVIIDVDGTVLASDRSESPRAPEPVTSADRCVLIGAFDAEQTLWDTSDGSRIETLDAGIMTGRSADGCTITYLESPLGGGDAAAAARLVGPDVDRSVEGELGAVAPDGSAAMGRNEGGAFVVDADSGDLLDLDVDTLFAVFTDR